MRSTVDMRLLAACALAALSGCGGTDDVPRVVADASETAPDAEADGEASVDVDAGADSVAVDSASDSGVVDALAPFDILGTASGECGVIKTLVKATSSVVVEIPLTFDATDKCERARLSPGGKIIFDSPNAGGSSKESEVMTYELLLHCDDAVLLKTETVIKYGPAPDGSKATITDMVVSIAGEKIGANPKRVVQAGAAHDDR